MNSILRIILDFTMCLNLVSMYRQLGFHTNVKIYAPLFHITCTQHIYNRSCLHWPKSYNVFASPWKRHCHSFISVTAQMTDKYNGLHTTRSYKESLYDECQTSHRKLIYNVGLRHISVQRESDVLHTSRPTIVVISDWGRKFWLILWNLNSTFDQHISANSVWDI